MKKKQLIRFDWAMKYILRNKANFDVLEGFISNLLKETIKIDSILESESNREEENRKFNRVDLMCTDAQGRHIIIEIQNQREVDYLQRLLWGASQTITENLQLGVAYKEVIKVISISILYFSVSKDKEYLYKGQTEFLGMHDNKPLKLHDKKLKAVGVSPVNVSSIFPEYYLIDVERFEDIVNEEIDEWVYFFKNGEIRDDFTSPGILLASQRLDLLSMDKNERRNYEKYLAYLASERDILTTARDEGIAEGIGRGIEQGIAQGIEQGIEQGIVKAKQELVSNMFDAGMDSTQIATVTGLSKESVEKIVSG